MSAPLIALSGVTLAAAAASATLSINADALAIGSFSCIGCSLLGVCAADRPVGCDARRRSCIGNAFSINAAALDFGSLGGTGHLLLGVGTADRPVGCDASRCSVSAPLIALSGVTLTTAAASAMLFINAAALAIRSLGGTGRLLLGDCTADRPVGCDA